MYLTQEKPYRPLLVALMFLTLPLAMILHNIVQIAFSDGQGLLVTVKDGVWAWQSGWQDSVAWFVCGMFAFLNLPIAGGLTKLAYKKNDAPAFALRPIPCRCRSVCLSGGRLDF